MLLGSGLTGPLSRDPKDAGHPYSFEDLYFSSMPAISGNRWLWRIEEAARLGCQVMEFGLSVSDWADPDRVVEPLLEVAEARHIQLLPVTGADYYADSLGERQRAAEQVVHQAEYLCTASNHPICATTPPRYRDAWVHRWRQDLPLEEQFARLEQSLGVAALELKRRGYTLAIENHCDFRSDDILELIDRIGGNALKVHADPCNGVAVLEDPIEAARKLGPLTVRVHIKGIRIRPVILNIGTVITAAPLGQGDFDERTILGVLADLAPDPENLPVLIEHYFAPAGVDHRQWYLNEIEYARTELADFWKERWA